MNIAILTISSLSLAFSATTLVVVLVGAKKVEAQVAEVKEKANRSVQNVKNALENLEL